MLAAAKDQSERDRVIEKASDLVERIQSVSEDIVKGDSVSRQDISVFHCLNLNLLNLDERILSFKPEYMEKAIDSFDKVYESITNSGLVNRKYYENMYKTLKEKSKNVSDYSRGIPVRTRGWFACHDFLEKYKN